MYKAYLIILLIAMLVHIVTSIISCVRFRRREAFTRKYFKSEKQVICLLLVIRNAIIIYPLAPITMQLIDLIRVSN